MGDTRHFAERMDLLAMTPRGDLSSTGYALANPGREYLVLQPQGAGYRFTVTLEPGAYGTEWFTVDDRRTIPGEATTVEGAAGTTFRPPPATSGPTVLYLASATGPS